VYTERVLTRVTCLDCALKLWTAMLSNLQTTMEPSTISR